MSAWNDEEGYVPLVRRNAQGREIIEPVIPEDFYYDYFSQRPVGPRHLPPMPRFENLQPLPLPPRLPTVFLPQPLPRLSAFPPPSTLAQPQALLPPRAVASSRMLPSGTPIALASRVLSNPPPPIALAPIPQNLQNTSPVLTLPSTTISHIRVHPGHHSDLASVPPSQPLVPPPISLAPPPITLVPPPNTLVPARAYVPPFPLITAADIERRELESEISPLIERYVGGKRKRSRKTKKSKKSKKSKSKKSRKHLQR